MYTCICDFSSVFDLISSYSDRSYKRQGGRQRTPARTGSVQCVARGVRSKFYSAGEDEAIPGFICEAIILHFLFSCFFEYWCFCSYLQISLKTARLDITLWKRFAVQGKVLGCIIIIIINVWAPCVPCITSRVHAPCVMRYLVLFYQKNKTKKQAARPNRLGATLRLRTRVRDPASVSVCLCWREFETRQASLFAFVVPFVPFAFSSVFCSYIIVRMFFCSLFSAFVIVHVFNPSVPSIHLRQNWYSGVYLDPDWKLVCVGTQESYRTLVCFMA